MAEEQIEKKEFMYSILYFFIKNKFNLTSKRIRGEVPNLLIFFPIGKKEATYPLKNIAGVSMNTKLHIFRAIFGLLITFTGIGMVLEGEGGGILAALIGISLLLHSRRTSISISNNAGQTMHYPISTIEKDAAQSFVNKVNNTIMEE